MHLCHQHARSAQTCALRRVAPQLRQLSAQVLHDRLVQQNRGNVAALDQGAEPEPGLYPGAAAGQQLQPEGPDQCRLQPHRRRQQSRQFQRFGARHRERPDPLSGPCPALIHRSAPAGAAPASPRSTGPTRQSRCSAAIRDPLQQPARAAAWSAWNRVLPAAAPGSATPRELRG